MKQRLERFEDWHRKELKSPARRRGFEKVRRATFLAYRIQGVRERLGLTQKEFAERMGMKQSALARIEGGKGETLKLSTLERAARAAHMELVVLFVKSGRMPIPMHREGEGDIILVDGRVSRR